MENSFTPRLERAMIEFIELLEKGEFFEANEVLEEVWRPLPKGSPVKLGLKGLINGAVTLELKKRGRESYPKIWKIFHKYKEYYPLLPFSNRAVELLNRLASPLPPVEISFPFPQKEGKK
ncbi:MAG: hypothetical protein C6I01_01515 [Epsilonproteobacteria bacterium]|nr:hypothetical protein [Campylobacterota bacterium]NPA89348.1 DUF309 domain-containing protein [Campylobacterota bacterium]